MVTFPKMCPNADPRVSSHDEKRRSSKSRELLRNHEGNRPGTPGKLWRISHDFHAAEAAIQEILTTYPFASWWSESRAIWRLHEAKIDELERLIGSRFVAVFLL